MTEIQGKNFYLTLPKKPSNWSFNGFSTFSKFTLVHQKSIEGQFYPFSVKILRDNRENAGQSWEIVFLNRILRVVYSFKMLQILGRPDLMALLKFQIHNSIDASGTMLAWICTQFSNLQSKRRNPTAFTQNKEQSFKQHPSNIHIQPTPTLLQVKNLSSQTHIFTRRK